ncbi:MAG: OmpA family protein [bacterium]|nr:OmpA family protein [bacterium]
MQRSTIVAIAAVVLVAVGALLTWQFIRLGDQIANLNQQAEDLTGRLDAAESRATEAEARADRAEQEAAESADQAAAARTREQQSAEQALEAETARQEATESERLAATARRDAELQAQAAAIARAAAEQQRAAAEKRSAELATETQTAREEAHRARVETEKIRRRLEQELDRLQNALGRIAETRRTALGLVMTLDSNMIEFDFDKADLRPQNRELLSRIVGVLLTFESYGVQVFGHTDDVGTVEYNQLLSERRAEAVRGYLVEAGIDPAVLSTMGLGKSSPLVEGSDPQSRQRNRRVELAIVFSEGEFEAISED